MYKLAWGSKRSCQECETRFYDLGQSPATCPKCGTLFELITGGRRKSSRKGAALEVVETEITISDNDVTIEDDSLLEDDIDSDAKTIDIPTDKESLIEDTDA